MFLPKHELFFERTPSERIVTSIWNPLIFFNYIGVDRRHDVFADLELEGTTLMFVDHSREFLCHYFHFLEHLLGIWEFGGCEERENVRRIILCGEEDKNDDFDWRGANQISQKLLRALFPHAEVFTLKKFKEKHPRPLLFHRVLLSSRKASYKDPECGKINKMLGGIWSSLSSEKLEILRSLVFSHCGVVVEQDRRCPRITYLHRNPPRRLEPKLEKRLLSSISDLVGFTIPVTDLAKISFEEQMRIIANTDVLISVHSNGLSHIPFLPSHAIVIELFPPDCFQWDYLVFSKIRRINYWGNSQNFWVTPQSPPQWGAFGDPNREVIGIDRDSIVSIIRDQMQRMGCN